MFYKSAIIKFSNREYNINIGYRLSADLAAGLVAGFYLLSSILRKSDSLNFSPRSISIELQNFDSENVRIGFDDEFPEFLTKYLAVKGKDVTPNSNIDNFSEIKFIYWVLADVYKEEFILFQFESSDFIRGIVSVMNSFKIEIRILMYSLPFMKARNWKNISFSVKTSENDLLYSKELESLIPYKPRTKYSDYCQSKETFVIAQEKGVSARNLEKL